MLSILVVLSLTLSSAATAETPPAAQPEKKVCRFQQSTGSVLTKQVCHTRAEWERITAAANHVEKERDQTPPRMDGIRPAG